MTAFIVERGFKGLSTDTLHGKLGIHAGNTGIVNLDDCEVPAENRVGEEGEGFLIAMSAIDQGRYTVAAGAVGLAQACLDASLKYAHERQTFGEEIGRHQLVKQMIAKMAAGTEIGRLLVWRAGWLKNQGLRNTRETSLAKWHATEHAVAGRARRDPGPRRERLLERVPGRALPAQLEGGRDLRGHQPAPYPDPGRLRARLSRGSAAALRALAGPGLRATGRGGRAGMTAAAPSPPASSAGTWSAEELATLAAVAETFVRGRGNPAGRTSPRRPSTWPPTRNRLPSSGWSSACSSARSSTWPWAPVRAGFGT